MSKVFRIRVREDVWSVYDIPANSLEEAERVVENETTDDLRSYLVDSGCTFCGIEDSVELIENKESAS